MKNIGERLLKARKKRGLSIRKLSIASGLTDAQISYMEKNQRNYTIESLEKYCAALDLNLEIL
jgi:transcriptional regulator with XRE-family HTH domain